MVREESRVVGGNLFPTPASLLTGDQRACPQLHWEVAGSNGCFYIRRMSSRKKYSRELSMHVHPSIFRFVNVCVYVCVSESQCVYMRVCHSV